MRCGKIVLFFLVFANLSFVASVAPSPGHNPDEIFIKIGEYTMTLQEALTNNFLKDGVSVTAGSYTASSSLSHPGDEIEIYLGGIVSLQKAIDDGTTFCRDPPGVFTWLFSFGHDGDNVVFGDGESLQDKIDGSGFCSYEWNMSEYPEWTQTCDSETRTRNVWCQRSDGKDEGDNPTLCTSTKPDLDETRILDPCPTCNDGILNQNEVGTDCGGVCGSVVPDYSWYESGFGSCFGTCGTGSQSQNVYCNRCDDVQVADGNCLGGTHLTTGCATILFVRVCGICCTMEYDNPKPSTSKSCNTGTACPTESCFVAGTEVKLYDGSVRLIEDVRIGDVLLGMDNSENVVLGYDYTVLGDRKLYSFNDGTFFVTAEHPFMTKEGWKSIDPEATRDEGVNLEVGRLEIGDYVMVEGGFVQIEMIRESVDEHDLPLYNFELDGTNTYYADGYLVHNKDHN